MSSPPIRTMRQAFTKQSLPADGGYNAMMAVFGSPEKGSAPVTKLAASKRASSAYFIKTVSSPPPVKKTANKDETSKDPMASCAGLLSVSSMQSPGQPTPSLSASSVEVLPLPLKITQAETTELLMDSFEGLTVVPTLKLKTKPDTHVAVLSQRVVERLLRAGTDAPGGGHQEANQHGRRAAPKYPTPPVRQVPVRENRREKHRGHGTTREKGCGASMRAMKLMSKK